VIIILITAYKNFLYSSGFGLTYKRIGVFIYLLLCISGMVTTYIKVARRYGLYFMFRTNARVAFIVMVMVGSFSWDRMITRYNLEHVSQPDMEYLYDMSYNNGDLLHAYAKLPDGQLGAHPTMNLNQDKIQNRYERWQRVLSKETWQSKTLNGLLNNATDEKFPISN
jgi:hypothetical protein